MEENYIICLLALHWPPLPLPGQLEVLLEYKDRWWRHQSSPRMHRCGNRCWGSEGPRSHILCSPHPRAPPADFLSLSMLAVLLSHPKGRITNNINQCNEAVSTCNTWQTSAWPEMRPSMQGCWRPPTRHCLSHFQRDLQHHLLLLSISTAGHAPALSTPTIIVGETVQLNPKMASQSKVLSVYNRS